MSDITLTITEQEARALRSAVVFFSGTLLDRVALLSVFTLGDEHQKIADLEALDFQLHKADVVLANALANARAQRLAGTEQAS